MQNWVCANCAPAAILAASLFGRRAGARPVGHVHRIGKGAQWLRLAQKILTVAGDRRRDLGSDRELPRLKPLLQAGSRSRRFVHGLSGVADAMDGRGWKDALIYRL